MSEPIANPKHRHAAEMMLERGALSANDFGRDGGDLYDLVITIRQFWPSRLTALENQLNGDPRS